MKLLHVFRVLLFACLLCYPASAWADEYEYDELNRLISATMDSGERVTYSYDASGNITSVRQVQAPRAMAISQPMAAAGAANGWETYSSPGVSAEYESVASSVYGDGVRIKAFAQSPGEVSISQTATVTGNTYYQLQGEIDALSLNDASIQVTVQFSNDSGQPVGESNTTYVAQGKIGQALSIGAIAPSDAVTAKIQFTIRLGSEGSSADVAVSGIRLLQAGGKP